MTEHRTGTREEWQEARDAVGVGVEVEEGAGPEGIVDGDLAGLLGGPHAGRHARRGGLDEAFEEIRHERPPHTSSGRSEKAWARGPAAGVQDRLEDGAQRRDGRHLAEAGDVAGHLALELVDRVDGRLLDILWRRKIRLAGSEVDHVIAFATQALGIGGDFHGGRRADQRYSVG